ncbi:MAG TPA: hypothetical protein VFZ41_09400 [Solirubrobacterales bacterium]
MSARLLALALSIATLGSAGGAADAAAAPPPPVGLEVEGGEGTWHTNNVFRLDWTNPSSEPPVAAVIYRIGDEQGAPVGEVGRIDWPARSLPELTVPGPPGSYTIAVSLEDSIGEEGPPATASLRYDNVRPPDSAPRPIDGWIGRTGFPLTVRIEPPEGALPVSGIRGYAVSVDDSPTGEPCADARLCTDAETDLRDGIGGDAYRIPELPEGTSHVHVVAVSGSGMRSRLAGHTPLRVDTEYPATRISGVPLGWANHPVAVTVSATDAGSGMEADAGSPGGGPYTAIRVDDGAPLVVAGDSAHTTLIEAGVHRVAHYARDAAGNVADGAAGNRPPEAAVVRIDREPPAVHFRSWQDPADPELIEALVSDRLSGPSEGRGSIEVRRAGSVDEFEALPTEVSGRRLRARWNSEAHPPGEYEFRAVGHDAAGNTAATTRRSDGSAMVLPNPLKATTILRAGFGGSRLVWLRCTRVGRGRRCRRETAVSFDARPTRRTVPYRRRVLFSGRLASRSGTPLADAPVHVVERFADGARQAQRVSVVRTGAEGRFSIRLAAGPSREISALFTGTAALGRSGAPEVDLGVRSAVRLRVSSPLARVGGRPVIFSGRVLAQRGTLPDVGKSVALQFRLPGLDWAAFRTLRTDRRGRFRFPYRFSDDDSRGVRFQFRAHAPAQAGWPYEPGGSRPVAVTGK